MKYLFCSLLWPFCNLSILLKYRTASSLSFSADNTPPIENFCAHHHQTRDAHNHTDHFLLLARETKELLPLFNEVGSRALDTEFWIQFLPAFLGIIHFTLPFSFLYLSPPFLQGFILFYFFSHFSNRPKYSFFKTATTSQPHRTSYLLPHYSSPSLFSQSSHNNYFYLCLQFSRFSLPTRIWILLPSFHLNNFC